MRILGVDWGGARIGLAVAETTPFVASPRPALTASGKLKTDAQAIVERANREEAQVVVVGLPLELDGVEGKMARIVRQLGGHLEGLGVRVAYAEESFTSVEADTALREFDLTAAQRRKLLDGEAACRILERWVDQGGPDAIDHAG